MVGEHQVGRSGCCGWECGIFSNHSGPRVYLATYNSANNKWSKLPKCPNFSFSLAIVNSLLTAIGGETINYEVTNSLLSLSDNKWSKWFPSMPTKCRLTAVV